MKLALRKLKQLTHEKTTVSDVFPPSSSVVSPGGGSGGGKFGTFPRKRRGSDERGTSPGAVSNKGKSPRGSGDLTDFDREFPPAEVKSKPRKNPLRKMPTVQGDSSHQPPSFSALLEKVSEEREEGEGGEREEESEDLHLVFQLCRDVSSSYRQILPRVTIHRIVAKQTTVEPPNKRHFGAKRFVPCREVVPISEVK